MAEIALAVGTSHGPLLNTPPEQWEQRANADRRSRALAFRGKDYTFAELNDLRGGAFEEEGRLDVRQRRHADCREAIADLGRRVTAAQLDALVVVSSDHKETFDDELLPQFAFLLGRQREAPALHTGHPGRYASRARHRGGRECP